MGYTYRGSGPWGPGKGSDLTAVEVDANFWQAQQDIAAKAVQGVGIANFQVIGNLMYVVLTDHTLLGPYTLPVATLNFKGPWLPNTGYLANDVVSYNGANYVVLINHTSAATFDPGANDGAGHNFYQKILDQPSIQLPAGGPAGYLLMKATAADFNTVWGRTSLANLADVGIGSPVNVGDSLQWTGSHWTNAPGPSTATPPLSTLSDVSISAPAQGQPLAYNGSKWANVNAVDLPVQAPFSSTAFGLDRANGEVQRIQLTGNATITSIANWPSTGQVGRLVLEVTNTGAFTLTWPSAIRWPGGGGAPPLTPASGSNVVDVFVLVAFDGGSTVYGNVVGQNYM